MSVALYFNNLTISYNDRIILKKVTGHIPQAVIAALVGPNGAGKSSFIKTLMGLHRPQQGTVSFFGKPLSHMHLEIAYMPQRAAVDWDFPATALDIVIMGRYGKLGWFRRPSQADWHKAHEALALVGLSDYAHRSIRHLSGGQQQRLFLARALVQEASLFLLDEPFAGIDATSEKIIMALLHDLKQQGKTVLIVHHELTKLHTYFDWALLIDHTNIMCGPVGQIITPQSLNHAYGSPL